MKKIVSISILTAIIFYSSASFAQTDTSNNTLLWEITGKGLSKPSYLFGTIHMICEEDYVLREKVTKALAKTTQFITEINFTDSTEMKSLKSISLAEIPLSKKLSPEKYKELEDGLKTRYQLNIKMFEKYTVETIGSIIALKVFTCTKVKMYEAELLALARLQKKSILGLEKVADQKMVLEKASGEDYIFNLLKVSKEFNTAYKNIIQWYKTEEVDKLYNELTTEIMMPKESKKWMLTNRNNNWVQKLPTIMQEKSSFIAVGAAHLGGDEGLINLLKKAGYTVNPIMN
jgi:uncharacterized protein